MSRLPHLHALLLRVLALAALILIAAALLFGADGNAEVDPDLAGPATLAYRSSAFLHGFRHGYEAGFYEADLDLHLGHTLAAPKDYHAYRDVHYNAAFGDRSLYTAGYHAGFALGFKDMVAGLDFRALDLIAAAQHDGAADLAVLDPHQFDSGVAQGFLSASRRDSAAEKIHLPRAFSASDCDNAARSGYCSGLRVGKFLAASAGIAEPSASRTAALASAIH